MTMSFCGFNYRTHYSPASSKDAKDLVRMHYGDFGAKMEPICRMFDGQDFITSDVTQRIDEAETKNFGYYNQNSLRTAILQHAENNRRVFKAQRPDYVSSPYFQTDNQYRRVISWTPEYLSCVFPERYSKEALPTLTVVPEPEEDLPCEPVTKTVETVMIVETLPIAEFSVAFKLLSLCPAVDINGLDRVRIPKDFPLEKDELEKFVAFMSDAGVLNDVGSNEYGTVWQVNRLGYVAYAAEHHIDLHSIVATDLDEYKIKRAIRSVAKDLDATDDAITTAKIQIAELDDEENKLRTRIAEITSLKNAKCVSLSSHEIQRTRLISDESRLDVAFNEMKERRNKYLTTTELLESMPVSDRRHLFEKFSV